MGLSASGEKQFGSARLNFSDPGAVEPSAGIAEGDHPAGDVRQAHEPNDRAALR